MGSLVCVGSLAGDGNGNDLRARQGLLVIENLFCTFDRTGEKSILYGTRLRDLFKRLHMSVQLALSS